MKDKIIGVFYDEFGELDTPKIVVTTYAGICACFSLIIVSFCCDGNTKLNLLTIAHERNESIVCVDEIVREFKIIDNKIISEEMNSVFDIEDCKTVGMLESE